MDEMIHDQLTEHTANMAVEGGFFLVSRTVWMISPSMETTMLNLTETSTWFANTE